MKKVIGLAVTLFCTIGISMNVFAGTWVGDAKGWWFDKGDNTWPANQWMWIDGNNDGIAECYYFNQYGYCLMNTTTPDNYNVNANGAWTMGSDVQKRTVSVSKQQGTSVKATPLFLRNPAHKSLVWYEAAAITSAEKAHWTSVIQISPSSLNASGMVSYTTEGQYKKLRATVAPEDDWHDWGDGSASAKLIVYVDGNAVAYESPVITKDTKAFSIEVDITGKQAFSIKATETGGSAGHIILRDAVIE